MPAQQINNNKTLDISLIGAAIHFNYSYSVTFMQSYSQLDLISPFHMHCQLYCFDVSCVLPSLALSHRLTCQPSKPYMIIYQFSIIIVQCLNCGSIFIQNSQHPITTLLVIYRNFLSECLFVRFRWYISLLLNTHTHTVTHMISNILVHYISQFNRTFYALHI